MEDRLRLLARWQARRRDVDELLGPLLAHGPAAVDRVTLKLAEVTAALAAEREAYATFEAAASRAFSLDPPALATAPVDELAAARRRAHRGRAEEAGPSPVLEVVDPPAPRPALEDEAP